MQDLLEQCSHKFTGLPRALGVWWSNGHLCGPRNTCQEWKTLCMKTTMRMCLKRSDHHSASPSYIDIKDGDLWSIKNDALLNCSSMILCDNGVTVTVALKQIHWYWCCLHIPDGLSMVILEINGGRRSQLYWWSVLSYPSFHWNHFPCRICKGVSFLFIVTEYHTETEWGDQQPHNVKLANNFQTYFEFVFFFSPSNV